MKCTHSQNDEQIAASFDENMEFVQFENIVSGYLNMPQLAFDVVGIDYCKELIFSGVEFDWHVLVTTYGTCKVLLSFSLLWNLWSQCCTFIYVELDVDNFVVLAIVSSIFCYLYPARAIRALSFSGAILRTWILKSIWEGLTIWNSPESSRKWQLLYIFRLSFPLVSTVSSIHPLCAKGTRVNGWILEKRKSFA